jgi:hypothetical protein
MGIAALTVDSLRYFFAKNSRFKRILQITLGLNLVATIVKLTYVLDLLISLVNALHNITDLLNNILGLAAKPNLRFNQTGADRQADP